MQDDACDERSARSPQCVEDHAEESCEGNLTHCCHEILAQDPVREMEQSEQERRDQKDSPFTRAGATQRRHEYSPEGQLFCESDQNHRDCHADPVAPRRRAETVGGDDAETSTQQEKWWNPHPLARSTGSVHHDFRPQALARDEQDLQDQDCDECNNELAHPGCGSIAEHVVVDPVIAGHDVDEARPDDDMDEEEPQS